MCFWKMVVALVLNLAVGQILGGLETTKPLKQNIAILMTIKIQEECLSLLSWTKLLWLLSQPTMCHYTTLFQQRPQQFVFLTKVLRLGVGTDLVMTLILHGIDQVMLGQSMWIIRQSQDIFLILEMVHYETEIFTFLALAV